MPTRRDADELQVRPGAQLVEQLCDVARVVLTVAVDLDRDVISVLQGEQVAGLHGAADAEVERQAEDPRSGPAGQRGCRVG
jgi:hypothetical protein